MGREDDVMRVEISMGCKQPVACYANKKQNFLVRAGRQCFPKESVWKVQHSIFDYSLQ